MFRLQQIDHVALTVKDLPGSITWYKKVLGLEQRYEDAWGSSPAMLCAGETCLALFAAHTPQPAGAPDPDTTLIMKHLAFRVDGTTSSGRGHRCRNSIYHSRLKTIPCAIPST